ncbi:hypothetical protein ACVWW1_000658 [Bradyrhizobium sp. JR3.5]
MLDLDATLAQIGLFAPRTASRRRRSMCSRRRSTRRSPACTSAKLTELRKDQADYIGVKQERPYGSDRYRYGAAADTVDDLKSPGIVRGFLPSWWNRQHALFREIRGRGGIARG